MEARQRRPEEEMGRYRFLMMYWMVWDEGSRPDGKSAEWEGGL